MKYDSGAVRNVAVSYSNFVDDSIQFLPLFDDVEKIDKEENKEEWARLMLELKPIDDKIKDIKRQRIERLRRWPKEKCRRAAKYLL